MINYKFRDRLFFVLCFFMVFNTIPYIIRPSFIGGAYQSCLVIYPLIMGMLYTVYCQYKYGQILIHFRIFMRYLLTLILITLLSLLWGLAIYPYYNDILQGPNAQIQKLPMVLHILHTYGVDVSAEILLIPWMCIRAIKGLLLEILYTFGGAYMIYCWYAHDWKRAFQILSRAIICSALIILGYSSIELFYLSGNSFAAELLKTITPYFHALGRDNFWWPPLLWKGQLRSIFAEPSYFGIYMAFCLPLFWYQLFLSSRRWWYAALVTALTFLLFLTKARTGVVIHMGELSILVILLLVLRDKVLWKKGCIVLCCSVFAFLGSNFFISTAMNPTAGKKNLQITESITNYTDSNIASLANPDQRSNRARYSVMEANFKCGLDHPILGVGRELRHAYLPDYFSGKALQSKEVNMWLNFQKKQGILKFGIPNLGEYAVRFCETGIVGLVLFLTPMGLLAWKLLRRIRYGAYEQRAAFMAVFISLAGMAASGIGDTLNIIYCYWLLLGLGYAMCFGQSAQGKEE